MENTVIPFKLTTDVDPNINILDFNENGGIESRNLDRVYFDKNIKTNNQDLPYIFEVIYDIKTKNVISIIEVDSKDTDNNYTIQTFSSRFEVLKKMHNNSQTINWTNEEKLRFIKLGIKMIANINYFRYHNAHKLDTDKQNHQRLSRAFNLIINEFEYIIKDVFMGDYKKSSYDLDATIYSKKMLGSTLFDTLKKEFEDKLRDNSTDDTEVEMQ